MVIHTCVEAGGNEDQPYVVYALPVREIFSTLRHIAAHCSHVLKSFRARVDAVGSRRVLEGRLQVVATVESLALYLMSSVAYNLFGCFFRGLCPHH